MQARMDVIRGAKTKEIMLRLPTVIGRGGDSKLKLPASTVSRHHCEIYEHDGQIVVRDLGSSNGTVVNGHKIKGPTFLTAQDELTIGPLTARLSPFEDAEAAPAPNYPVAPAEEAAPSFEELPAEKLEPTEAEEAAAASDSSVIKSVSPETKDEDGEASVLQYVEPKESGRSFVGIAPSEDAPESVSDSPVFDGLEAEAEPEVKSDDSALNNFFKNLDE